MGICGLGLPGICPPFLLGMLSQSLLRCYGSQGQGMKHMTVFQGLVKGQVTQMGWAGDSGALGGR